MQQQGQCGANALAEAVQHSCWCPFITLSPLLPHSSPYATATVVMGGQIRSIAHQSLLPLANSLLERGE